MSRGLVLIGFGAAGARPADKALPMRRDTDEFLDELAALFLAEGIRDLTIGEIARRMRCSRTRLYAIAPTKEEIFLFIVDRFFTGVFEEGKATAARAPNPARALIESLAVGVNAGKRTSVAFLRDVEASEQPRQSFDRYQLARTRSFSHLVDQGVAEGMFVECHGAVVAELVLGAALRLRQPAFLSREGLTLESAFDEFYRVLLRGLLTPERREGDSTARRSRKRNEGATPGSK